MQHPEKSFTCDNVSELSVPCCSRCKGPRNRPGQRYCFSCHAEDERKRRQQRKSQMQLNAAIMEQVRGLVGG